MEKCGALNLNKLESPSPKGKIWLKLAHWFWRRRFVKFRQYIFAIISPWKRVGPFIWTNLNPLHPRMIYAKFGWIWPSGSKEDFLNFVNVFSQFHNYLPLEKDGALSLRKLKSCSPKDTLCQVWLNLAQWFWRRRWKREKFTDRQMDGQTDRHMDNRWSEKLTGAFSSGELTSNEVRSHMG